MKKLSWAVCTLLLLFMLPFLMTGCGKSGQIKDTQTETAKQSETVTDTSTDTVTVPDPEPDTTSIPETQTDGNTETDPETEQDWAGYFGMNRDEIKNRRGESTPPDTEGEKNDDNTLYYQDKVAGYNGNSGYAFDQTGKLTGITVTFEEGITLDEVIRALTGLYGDSTEKDGSSVWEKDQIDYTLSEKDGKITLTMTSK